MPLITAPTGLQYFPTVGYEETYLPIILERFALRAEESRRRRRERQILRDLGIELPEGGWVAGQVEGRMPGALTETGALGPRQPSFLERIGRGIKDVILPEPEMTDIEKIIAEAQIKQKYPSATDLLTLTLLGRALREEGLTPDAIPPQPTEPPPEGYEWSLKEDKVEGVPVRRWELTKVKLTEKERFREDLRKAEAGEISWEDLRVKWPDKAEEIRGYKERVTELKKPPIKPVRSFLGIRPFRAIKPEYAAMNEATRAIAERIRTRADLRKLIEKAGQLRKAGVDVDALLKYYAPEIKEMGF